MKRTNRNVVVVGWIVAFLFLSLGAWADEGIRLISEGPVEEAMPRRVEVSARAMARAGFTAFGTFWSSVGGAIDVQLGPLRLYAEGQLGTDTTSVTVGAETTLVGFQVAGDVTLSGATTVVDLRAWGDLEGISVTGNLRLAGADTSLSIGGSADVNGLTVSATLGLSGNGLDSASVGVNKQVGEFFLSASGGLTGGAISLGGGAGFSLGSLSLAVDAGYDSGIGVNASASAGIGSGGFHMSAVALLDNTGIGAEGTIDIGLGQILASSMIRWSPGSVSFEVGAKIPIGALTTSIRVGLTAQNGFDWAELSIDWPLF